MYRDGKVHLIGSMKDYPLELRPLDESIRNLSEELAVLTDQSSLLTEKYNIEEPEEFAQYLRELVETGAKIDVLITAILDKVNTRRNKVNTISRHFVSRYGLGTTRPIKQATEEEPNPTII